MGIHMGYQWDTRLLQHYTLCCLCVSRCVVTNHGQMLKEVMWLVTDRDVHPLLLSDCGQRTNRRVCTLHSYSELIQAYLGVIVDFVSDNNNKVSISIKWVKWAFRLPRTYKNYVYTILQSIKCAIALRLKKLHMLVKKISYC